MRRVLNGSDNILTYSKVIFCPLEPVKDDIKIEDIAHSLSLMTRANGHFRSFYSVAQHSLNCCREALARGHSKRVQLACLLHDASESYISDLTRPVKNSLHEYSVIEEKLQNTIYSRFGLGDLSGEEQKQINEVDDTLLHFEFEALMGEPIFDPAPKTMAEHDFSQKDFITVEMQFINKFKELIGCKKGFKVVGIDGCRAGWVAVSITDKGFEVDVYENIEEICLKYDDYDSMIVDMPIGLPEAVDEVRPDSLARKILKHRAPCIFPTPCREAVYADCYEEANDINRQIMGKGLSRQSYALCTKVKEIDGFLSDKPQYKTRLLESHPEICFTIFNSGEPVNEKKHTPEGETRRIELLSHYYDGTQELIDYANQNLKSFKVDVIDALSLAVTGKLGIEKGMKNIPENPMKDKRGVLMRMHYAGLLEKCSYGFIMHAELFPLLPAK